MGAWIKTTSGEITLQVGFEEPVRIVVDTTNHPVVIVGNRHHYPSRWEGPALHGPGVSKWTYDSGPVLYLFVWKDKRGDLWVTPNWR